MTTRAYAALTAVAGAVLAAAGLFARAPARVEAVYGAHVEPVATRLLPTLTRWVPFSLAEVAVLVLVAWLTVPAARGLRRAGRGGWVRATAHEAARIAATAATLAAGFYLVWGLNYARPDLPTRAGWTTSVDPQGDAATAELASLAAELVTRTNEEYLAATGTEDLGHPSTMPRGGVDAAIDAGYERAAPLLGWPAGNAASRGPAKPALVSPLMSRMGLAGIYTAWTGEANYNRDAPPSQIPLSIAHEKAHQRGVASEDEANFVGWLAASLADSAYARYSAQLFAQRQLLTELQARDPDGTAALVAERLPGVQRDVNAANDYWRQFDGPTRAAQESFNNAYLEFNGVEGGIASYSRSAQLLVLFARQRGGDLLVQADEVAPATP